MKKLIYFIPALLLVAMFTGCTTTPADDNGVTEQDLNNGTTFEVKELFPGFIEPYIKWGASLREVQDFMDAANLPSSDAFWYKGDGIINGYAYGFELDRINRTKKLIIIRVTTDDDNYCINEFKKVYNYVGKRSEGFFIFTDKAKNITIRSFDYGIFYYPFMEGSTPEEINANIEKYESEHETIGDL